MTRFSKPEVYSKMLETGLIPVFYNKDLNICKEVLKACYNGGVRVFEFVNRGEFALSIFKQLIKYSEKEYPELILGIGSIIDVPTTDIYLKEGSNFIVSPVLNKKMGKLCNQSQMAWIPGCGTLSEILNAEKRGAEIIKIFPAAQLGGPGFIKAVKAPCPWLNLMPSGGVDTSEKNLKAWFSEGVACVGMGSKLITEEILEKKDYLALTASVKKAMNIIQKLRK